jgi:predicted  nucleic acid-binding Zn-ribbon protein
MATRDSSKSKRGATAKKAATTSAKKPPSKAASKSRAKPTPAKLTSAVEKLEAKFKALQVERDKLKAELAEAHARIKKLEAQQTDAVNRIDWVIDSLHNLVEDKT